MNSLTEVVSGYRMLHIYTVSRKKTSSIENGNCDGLAVHKSLKIAGIKGRVYRARLWDGRYSVTRGL